MTISTLALAALFLSPLQGPAQQGTEAPAKVSPAAAPQREPWSEEALDALIVELKEMMRLDQLHRTAVSWGTTDPEELARLEALDDEAHLAEWARRHREGIRLPKAEADELMRKQGILDAKNLTRLSAIIRKHGYPSPEKLEIDAPDPLPVLIHASLEGYDAIADDLLVEALAGRLHAKKYASLSDRKRQHRGQLQLYGTCRAMDVTSGKVLAPEIESIEATNDARAALGLPPLTEYRIAPKRASSSTDEKDQGGSAPQSVAR
ncbi:MAG: DUF6624 domain-containing protein [Planctomycetota bacterium]